MMRVFPVYTIHVRLPGPSVHGYLPPPPPVPGPVFPMPGPSCAHFEGLHTVKWVHPGKITSTVELDRFRVAKEGHDTGALIPHIGVPPNAGMALAILFSKYKILFGAGTVQANGSPVGTFFPVLAPPLFCSSPCSLPAILPPLHNIVPFPNTVGVGMSFKDFFRGWVSVVLEMVIDMFFTFLFGSDGPFNKFFDAIGKAAAQLFAPLLKGVASAVLQAIVKQFAKGTLKSLMVGLLKGLIAYLVRGKGGRIDLPIVGMGIEYDPKTNKLHVGPPGNPKMYEIGDLGSGLGAPPAAHSLAAMLPAGTPAAI